MKLKGEELRKNRRKRVNLWLSNPHMQNEELRKDQKEHPEKWVEYYIRMASEWRKECMALDAELDEKEIELKEKENELIEIETELKNKELSLSVDRLGRVEEERLRKASRQYESCSKRLFAATCIYVVLIVLQLIKMFSLYIG